MRTALRRSGTRERWISGERPFRPEHAPAADFSARRPLQRLLLPVYENKLLE